MPTGSDTVVPTLALASLHRPLIVQHHGAASWAFRRNFSCETRKGSGVTWIGSTIEDRE